MSITLDPWTPDTLETLRTLVRHPSLAAQFDTLTGPGELEHWLADPFSRAEARWLARVDGKPAGFAICLLLPGAERPWAMVRLGVTEPFRRRGVGSRLLARAAERIPALHAGCGELALAAWEPCDEAIGFAAARGLVLQRRFWLMERPVDGLREPSWPAGIEVRSFDGSDRALAGWNDAYNASFAQHFRFVPSTVDTCRALAEAPEFVPGGLLLAYRGSRCVGFCRDQVHAASGEVASIGVAPEARGIGLGRALLRAGARWLVARGALPVTLLVDGENEGALALYRSESFVVKRTRRFWALSVA